MSTVLEKYADQLIAEGVVTAEEVKDVKDKYEKICEDAYNQAKQETHIKYKDWLDSPWSGFFEGKDPLKVISDVMNFNYPSSYYLNNQCAKLQSE